MPAQSNETTRALQTLVQHVSRAFYESRFVVVMDQLARLPVYVSSLVLQKRLLS